MKIGSSIQLKRIVILAACIVLCVPASAQDDRCGAGKDLVVQALERISPQST